MFRWLTQLLCKNHIWIEEKNSNRFNDQGRDVAFTYNVCVKCDKVGGSFLVGKPHPLIRSAKQRDAESAAEMQDLIRRRDALNEEIEALAQLQRLEK